MTSQQVDFEALLQQTYHAINTHDVETMLETLHPEVSWANGMEGGFASGRDEIRTYWEKQWEYIDPHLKPIRYDAADNGQVVVEVHQIIRDLLGNIISIKNVQHVFWFEDGFVRAMRIAPGYYA